MEIKSIVEYPEARSVLIHGNPGSGKTTLASTSPKPILFVDVEAGLTGLGRVSEIDFAVVKNVADVRSLYTELIASKEIKYKTIVIDSMTQLADWIIDEVKKKKKNPEDPLDQGEWGKVTEQLNSLTKAFRDFPLKRGINLVITALTKESQDDTKLYHKPDITGKASMKVSALMDAVLYTYITETAGKPEYKVLTRETGRTYAKSRGAAIPTIVLPNMIQILDMLNQREMVKAG